MNRPPYYIRAVIDIHTLPRAEANEIVIEQLQEDGLVEKGLRDGEWKTTARGSAYVELLCEVPLPEQKWIDPRKAKA